MENYDLIDVDQLLIAL